MFNSDGSEGEMCGNGIRCFTKYAIEHGVVPRPEGGLTVDTLAGIRTVVPVYEETNGNRISRARVAMGTPRLNPADLPARLDPTIAGQPPVLRYPLNPGGHLLSLALVSMGNPHAVTFIEQAVAEFPLHRIGPLVEGHPIFPRRVNFEIVNVVDAGHLDARVWERGSGETLACGTGACAIAVAARLQGITGDIVDIRLPGGTLTIEWDGQGEVYLEGPAEEVFSGEWER
jgi:diaminopimelate epimerase